MSEVSLQRVYSLIFHVYMTFESFDVHIMLDCANNYKIDWLIVTSMILN